MKEFGKERGAEILFLQVERENSAGGMYRKLGFSFLCSRISYFQKLSGVKGE